MDIAALLLQRNADPRLADGIALRLALMFVDPEFSKIFIDAAGPPRPTRSAAGRNDIGSSAEAGGGLHARGHSVRFARPGHPEDGSHFWTDGGGGLFL